MLIRIAAPLLGLFFLGAAAPDLVALAKIQPGQWVLKERDGTGQRSLCLGDPRQLLTPRHAGRVCEPFVVGNAANQAVVTYRCTGGGSGRTTLRVETAQLIQLETQGIADAMPFNVMFEGRRVGECAGTPAR